MSRRRAVLVGVGVVALLAVATATLYAIDNGDGFGFMPARGLRAGSTWRSFY